MQAAHSCSRFGTRHAVLLLSALLLVVACDDDPTAPAEPAVSGTVVASSTGDPVAGATVSIGAVSVTTGPDGRFALTGLTAGAATLHCIATGFEDLESPIVVASESINRDIHLARIELFDFGDFALYAPASISNARGILVALGGPNTRGFASGAAFGAPVAEVEASLQTLGQQFRALARGYGLAVLGTSLAALPNGPESDQLILDAIRQAAALSGRPELESAPLLLYGMSGGAAQSSGFAARHASRVAALFLKVPAGVEPLTAGAVLGVPTYMVQAELDAFVDNTALTAAFEANRRAGALWARALEPGVPHHSLSPAQRELTVDWMNAILGLRLGAAASDPLRGVTETSGWLGDPVTGAVAPWASYPGDRGSASWFPSQVSANRWQDFVGGSGSPGSLTLDAWAFAVIVGASEPLGATVLNVDGITIQNPAITWTSDDKSIATVPSHAWCSEEGCPYVWVKGVAPGEATITASYGDLSARITVTVVPSPGPEGSLTLHPSALTVRTGDWEALGVTVFNGNGTKTLNAALTWTSNDESVAIAPSHGWCSVEGCPYVWVNGVRAGETTITARYGDLVATIPVTVLPASSQ